MKTRWFSFFFLLFGFAQLNAVGITLQDGLYKVAFDKPDTHGYKGFLEIRVTGGRIDSAIFDYVNSKDGSLKSEDPAYEKAMKEKVGVGPQEYGKVLIRNFLTLQNANVDVVAGATESSLEFRLLAQEALNKATAGDTTASTIPQKD